MNAWSGGFLMATINSVLGPLNTSKMGFTLMHEHIISGAPPLFNDYPELFGKDPLDCAVTELKMLKAAGIDTIMDDTTPDLGRDINFMSEASHMSGVNILCCTGWWLTVPAVFATLSIDQLTMMFVKDIEEGISGSCSKPAVLKTAADMPGVTPELEKVHRAIARAHLKTGIPIVLHSFSPGQVGRQQLAILKEEGVNPKRIKFDHSNDTTDVEYLLSLLKEGCYLGLDRYPGRNASPQARTRTLKALIDAGYAGRLCLSHDRTLVGVQGDATSPAELERRKLNPHGFLYIKNIVFPMLKEMGVSETVINSLCIDGPRNFFEGK
jgi:phosphotriesterase-related protein